MAKPSDSENKVQRKSSAAVHGRQVRAVAPRKSDDETPLSTRALDYEGRIADLQAKILELEESRSTLASLLRDLETKEGRIEHIHQSWVAVFDAIVDPIFMHDREGRVVRANRAYAELAGMGIKDIIGRLYWRVFPRREGPLANCALTLAGKMDRSEEDLTLEPGKIFRCRFFTLRDRAGGYLASLHIMQDITERKQAEEKKRESDESLRKLNRALRTLSGCNESLVHAMGEQELLAAICKVIVHTGGYRFAWVGYAEHDGSKSVRPMSFAGEETGFLDAVRFGWDDNESGHNPIGEAICTGSPQVIHNIETSSIMRLPREEALRRGYISSIALPLRNGATAMGVLAIYAAERDAFDDEEVKLLMELADDLVYGIGALRTRLERERAMELNRLNTVRMEKALLDTIEAIGSALEKRDPYTAGHQRQVAKLAHAMAQEMKLPQPVIEGIYMGGLIHDIGKIYVPAEILSRPGRLSEAEFNLIKAHPQVGYDIVKGIEFPWPVTQMILQHHERLDGSGYPQGLKDGQIALEAKILAVADVVEAMASHRPYRPGLGIDKALDEVSGNRGKFYDPSAVDACLRLFREKGFTFE